MSAPRILRCEHCRVWYTVQRAVPEICPYCEKPALWKSAESLEPKPFRLSKTDREFLLCNKIQPWDEEDDGA